MLRAQPAAAPAPFSRSWGHSPFSSSPGAATAGKRRQIVATPGALAALEASDQAPLTFLCRHIQGDWGEVCQGDGRANHRALRSGGRLFSAYRTVLGARLWVITEADRFSTCIFLPEEY